ncbi:ISLre2 family transposase [Streptococcus agalactiae]|uniref:Transposase n=1 Tax=Streptococcus agalactiae MRI Z1-216 TaxID=1154879 RepID=A0AAD3A4R3_STRAG|nr:ISLre2 family transposase [Streptococcus agalactiae]EPU37040.1 transposase [Streptococcus agalactiae MRI Z1-213]EPU39317.1 transposase [Streptococcus agalactiae MRI Z1-214]EPU42503.1 transposase [Streptococcus agalactiae MRI Z1-216]EPX07447.1 transposase [Streptococcus agalactiae MRI Z1-217]
MAAFDERQLKEQLIAQNATDFYDFISKYDEEMVPIMKARGYTCIHSMERTVAFTFGEFTYRRRRWKKGDKWVVPVDEKLGLKKNVRFSWEFMYQIARLSSMMPYEKVIQVIQMTYYITITKPTVVQAVKLCDRLLEERDAYRFYENSDCQERVKIDIIYIEGDGVMVKARDTDTDNKNYDLSHFVVHTGSRKVGSNRFELKDKKEFVGLDNRLVRDQVLDYLYNNYDITENTILITNSDGGHGYTPYVFKEMAKALRVKRHEHFWDEYHINQNIKTFFKSYSDELRDGAFQAIKEHNKEKLRTVLDTTESLILTEEEMAEFEKIKRKLLNNFQYTKPAELRGLSHAGIGIMESQHRKITYRMKKRGMYWTVWGSETMSRIIVLNYENKLRDLFFGTWREEYQKMIELENVSAGSIKTKLNQIEREYKLHHLKKRERKQGLRFNK